MESIEALLLSCMDYRFVEATARYMQARGLSGRYDHVILAGASLGATSGHYPAWNVTFWQHLEIASQLHNIEKVLLLDHLDCGAYGLIFGKAHAWSPQVEKDTHTEQLIKLRDMIREKHPQLKVETLLMALDGSVEAVG